MNTEELPAVRIKKILYATDLSESARLAFAYASDLANRYQAGLTILHVENTEAPVRDMNELIATYVGSTVWQEIKQRNKDSAMQSLIGKKRQNIPMHEVLDSFSKTFGDETVTDEIIVEEGQPVEVILRVAEERACDMIVMGSYGHSKFVDIMMGGTTRRVLRRSKIPVLTVRLPKPD